MSDLEKLLAHVAQVVAEDRAAMGTRPVVASATLDELRASVQMPLPESPSADDAVIADLIAAARPGVIASAGPRYFGFVIGGSTPAALAADWLTSGWDNNAGLFVAAPAATAMEETAARWVVELLRLPPETSVGFATGGMMANFTGLAVGRHRVLADAGWDVEARGLQGAPRVRVVVGEERHATIDMALRYLGLGAETVEVVPADEQGRMQAHRLAAVLEAGERLPTLVCAQAGDVNSGAFDDLATICAAAHAYGAWVHVDGAFGLWAAATDDLRHLVRGVEDADSWATDAHKWLNVPYDCGMVLCRNAGDHHDTMSVQASYLVQGGPGAPYDALEWVPEFSRRGRGVPVYAAIRALGRSGVADLISRCCAHARRFGAGLSRLEGVDVLNDVVLNQVLVRFGASDEMTRAVIDAVQADGTCWMGGTVWKGVSAMRISVSNWSTTEADVDLSVAAIERVFRAIRD